MSHTVTMSECDDSEQLLVHQIRKDNCHFKGLLDLVPPQSYFSKEEKDEIWDIDLDETSVNGKKKKWKNGNRLTNLSVTQITELREHGKIPDLTKQSNQTVHGKQTEDIEPTHSIETKQQGKKQSRSLKAKKKKGKELERREARLEELKERLRAKLEEIKGRKSAGNLLNKQEQKKLKRQEKKVNAKLKSKGGNHKEQKVLHAAEGLRSPPQNKILNQNGLPVKSKFDFSIISFGNDKQSSDLHGRDYKRLLEKVEKRKEKIEQLKEKDLEAGKKLEEKLQWQTVLNKAKGEKVKDDAQLLKKAAKRKDKIKDRKQKKWGDRVKTVNEAQKKKQDKRQANLDKRKDAKKEKTRKKMIKKGRIIPGF